MIQRTGGFNTEVVLTPVIVEMIFDVYIPYGERFVDYKAYIDLVLAYEHRDTPAGLQVFRISQPAALVYGSKSSLVLVVSVAIV